jgi:hypothetical protein
MVSRGNESEYQNIHTFVTSKLAEILQVYNV